VLPGTSKRSIRHRHHPEITAVHLKLHSPIIMKANAARLKLAGRIEMIRQRVHAGLKRAVEAGKTLGRPRISPAIEKRIQATVQPDAMRCDRCGVSHPTSELRAAILSPSAFAFFAIVLALLATFWFW
jgi:hypothetical protein